MAAHLTFPISHSPWPIPHPKRFRLRRLLTPAAICLLLSAFCLLLSAFCFVPSAFFLFRVWLSHRGPGRPVPPDVKTIAIPIFVNKTPRFRIEQKLAAAITRELSSERSTALRPNLPRPTPC